MLGNSDSEDTMTEESVVSSPALRHNEVSLLALGSVLIRWRRTIVTLGLVGATLGIAMGLSRTRLYVSSATFIPQGSEGGASGLALAASQLGIRVPSSGAWGPPVYVELLKSQALLEQIVLDTFPVAEEGNRRVALLDLLKVKSSTTARRTDVGVRTLTQIVNASEVKILGAVKLTVTTKWPSVSLGVAQRLVSGVNQFNLESRKSQAGSERRFVDGQAGDAEHALREAEDRLQVFLQRNRSIAGSPELGFQRDRLQREVALRQQVYTALLQNREDARIREVRDTPVITLLAEPRLPVVSESRHAVQKGVLGGLGGIMLGVLVALLSNGVSGALRQPTQESREFFQMVAEATAQFRRRRAR